jgi:hypothetical protein
MVKLLAMLDKTGDCWNWTGAIDDTGAGTICWKGWQGRQYRFAYEVFVGPIPEGMSVLHKCDNRRCCNPAHLFIGTQQDNIDDMIAKGRKPVGPGRKLSEDEVREIRRLMGEGWSDTKIAKWTGKVHSSTIYEIRTGRNWRLVI